MLSFITNDTQRRHVRSVCQQWCDYINYNEFKIGVLLTSEVDEFSRCFGRYQKPIGLKFFRIGYICSMINGIANETILRSSDMFHSMLRSLTQLTALDLCVKDFEVPQELINLRSLTVISPLHIDTLSRLTNLRTLKTDSALTAIPTTLESLDLWDSTNYRLNKRQINTVVDNTYSRLTELVISTTFWCEMQEPLTNLRKLSVFEFISHTPINLMKCPSLEEFITSSGTLPNHYPSTLTKLHVFSKSSSEVVEINEELTQLKELQCSRAKFHNINLMNSMVNCVVHNDNATLLELLDPQKVTKLKTTLTPENCHLFSCFTNLIDLDISLNEATTATMPYLVPLPCLKQMRLIYRKYPHQWMTQLPNLVDLQLERSSQEFLESIDFDMMHQLTSLELIGGYYNSISIINLTNLLHLRIYNATAPIALNIQGLSTATNLTSLSVKHLQLDSSSIRAQYTELALLTNLRMLSLRRTYGADITNIAELTKLQHLTFLEVPAIENFTRLTRLQQIYHTTTNNAILKDLPFCYQLQYTF